MDPNTLPIVPLFTRPLNEEPAGPCVPEVGCVPSNLDLTLLAAVVGLAVIFAAVLYVREAQTVVSEEQSRLRAERDAFLQFARRIQAIDAAGPDAVSSSDGPTAVLSAGSPGNELREVRRAYEETVMAVSHFDEDYDEPFGRNVAVELGTEIETALGVNDSLSRQLKRELVQRSERAATQREAFLSMLEDESGRLSDAKDRLAEIERKRSSIGEAASGRSFDDLRSDWDELDDAEATCSELLDDRQRELRDERSVCGIHDLSTYLYGGLDTTYPILADCTSTVDQLRDTKRHVLAELSKRS